MLSVSLDLWLNLGAKEAGSLHFFTTLAFKYGSSRPPHYTEEPMQPLSSCVLLQNQVLTNKIWQNESPSSPTFLLPINKLKPSISSHSNCCAVINILSEQMQHEVSVHFRNCHKQFKKSKYIFSSHYNFLILLEKSVATIRLRSKQHLQKEAGAEGR